MVSCIQSSPCVDVHSKIKDSMIHRNTFEFLRELKLNNSKEWMDGNKEKRYVFAKDDVLALTEELLIEVSEFDVNISNANLTANKCITRLNRDLRFSKDKTPYKTDYYIILNKDGKNSPSAFYYLHIEPKNCFVGGGIYNSTKEPLDKIRQAIDCSFNQWKKITKNKQFKEHFPSGIHSSGILKKIPRGFDEDSPAKEYLKMKGFYSMEKLMDEELISSEIFQRIKRLIKMTIILS